MIWAGDFSSLSPGSDLLVTFREAIEILCLGPYPNTLVRSRKQTGRGPLPYPCAQTLGFLRLTLFLTVQSIILVNMAMRTSQRLIGPNTNAGAGTKLIKH